MSDERTQLHWGVVEGDLQKVRDRIYAGDNVNQGDEEGWTPIISAAAAGNMEILEELIGAGADLQAKTRQGRNALFYAISKCSLPIAEIIVDHVTPEWVIDSSGNDPVHRALSCPRCSTEMLQFLKDHGAPFDQTDAEGNLPIHIACYEGRKDLAEWLVENTEASMINPKNADAKVPNDLLPKENVNFDDFNLNE